MDMSQVTVESLPEEVLVEVFKWLDTKSLKNVMLTCKEWADYVRRSHQWTLDLFHAFSLGDTEAALKSVLMANRKYNEVLITGFPGMDDVTILKIFEKHHGGAFIDELTIFWYHSTNASLWCKILNTMPNLKKARYFSTTWDESNNDLSDDELPPLHKVKTLELDVKSSAVLKLFKKCQLHTVSVNSFDHQSNEKLWTFLATQQDLKELKLDSGSCSASFENPVTEESIPFKLKKFSVGGHTIREMPTNSIDNLMKFMKLHKDTLEDLELQLKFPENFYEFVFSEFKHLKTLSLKVDDIPQTRLEVNGSVTSLELNIFGRANPLATKAFFGNLPNVQKLVMDGLRDFPSAKYIADNMKQLKRLEMNKVKANTFDGARFAALKSLRIRQLNGRVNWFAVAKNNPGINELWIGNVGKPMCLKLEVITQNMKLRNLTIESSELSCNENFFEVIRKNCPELKSLELNEKSLKVDISTVADIPGLRFRKF